MDETDQAPGAPTPEEPVAEEDRAEATNPEDDTASAEADADTASTDAASDEETPADPGDSAGADADATEPEGDAVAEGDGETAASDAAPLSEDAAPDGDADAAGTDEAAAADVAEAEDGLGAEAAAEGAESVVDAAELIEPAASGFNPLQPVIDIIAAGGPVIAILAILSVISLALILVKYVQFTALRIGDVRFVGPATNHLRAGDPQSAFDLVSRQRSVVARVMEAAVRGKLMAADETRVREEVTRVAQAKLDGLERGLPLLSLIATVSPLLGLLGTVLGMIDAFQQLEDAGDRVDPAILSGGIWEALLTTAAGLAVAIPSAAFFSWLQRAVDVAAQRMEDAATLVFTAELYQDAAVEGGEAQPQTAEAGV